MAGKKLNILAVCGSGVVTSSMIAQKIEEELRTVKIDCEVTGLVSTSVEEYVQRGNIDMVVTTSPLQGEINVPVIKAVPLMTGIGEEEVLEEIRTTAERIIAERT